MHQNLLHWLQPCYYYIYSVGTTMHDERWTSEPSLAWCNDFIMLNCLVWSVAISSADYVFIVCAAAGEGKWAIWGILDHCFSYPTTIYWCKKRRLIKNHMTDYLVQDYIYSLYLLITKSCNLGESPLHTQSIIKYLYSKSIIIIL